MRRRLSIVLLLVMVAAGGLGLMAQENRKGYSMSVSDIDPDAQDARGQSIIFKRVMEEDMAAIMALLDAGLDVDVRGSFNATPALRAAIADIWPVVALLLERGADPMITDRRGMTIPWLATTSRIAGNGPRAQALEKVRAQLADRGHLSAVYSPQDVTAMVAEGRWPPAPR